MKFILIPFLTFFLFNACSMKDEQFKSNQITKIQEINENEEFEDDFSDEFNEKNDEEKKDYLESYNRIMFTFNDFFYVNVLNPITKTYANVVPEVARKGISNVFKNIFYPVRLGNNLLQGKFENAYDETRRFAINSTIGVFGIMDIASSSFNIKEHNEDFGQTLGVWGVEAGPHIVIPFLGPSNLRDLFSVYADYYVDPTNNLGNLSYKIPNTSLESMAIYSTYIVNKNSLNLGLYESIKKDSIDFYSYSRDFYENKRLNDIKE